LVLNENYDLGLEEIGGFLIDDLHLETTSLDISDFHSIDEEEVVVDEFLRKNP